MLTVDDVRLNALSVDDLQYFETRFFLVPGTGTVYIDAKLSVIRQRAVANGFREVLTILNHDEKPVRLRVRIEAASDFADLFEVKDALKKKGKYTSRVERGALRLGYERETYARSTLISSSQRAKVDENGLTFDLKIPAHGKWTTELDVVAQMPGYGGLEAQPKGGRRRTMEANLDRWVAGRLRGSSATGSRSSARTGAASSTWLLCGSRRRSPEAGACRRPACPGS